MLVDSQQQPLKTNGSTALTLTLTTASTTFAETSVAVPATFVAVPATWFISMSTAEKGRGASEGAASRATCIIRLPSRRISSLILGSMSTSRSPNGPARPLPVTTVVRAAAQKARQLTATAPLHARAGAAQDASTPLHVPFCADVLPPAAAPPAAHVESVSARESVTVCERPAPTAEGSPSGEPLGRGERRRGGVLRTSEGQKVRRGGRRGVGLTGPTGKMSTSGLRNCENGDCIVGVELDTRYVLVGVNL